MRAHRAAYSLFYAEDLPKQIIRHDCDNPICVNPLHLTKGSPLDNSTDAKIRNRTHKPKGILNKRAILSEAEVLSIRSAYGPHSVIAASYGVSTSLVSMIKSKKRWPHL